MSYIPEVGKNILLFQNVDMEYSACYTVFIMEFAL